MAKDLKDLIDSVEVRNNTQNELERNLEFLQEEVRRLNFTIKEQKILIEELNKTIAEEGDIDIPGDIQLLKDMILSQRQDMIKRDKDIEILQKQLDELTFGVPGGKKSGKPKKNKDLIEAKKRIIQLTEENEILLVNDTNAKKILEKLANENERLAEKENTQTQQLQSCVTQIQRLESRINESTQIEALKVIKERNENLHIELELVNSQVHKLQRELEQKKNEAIINAEKLKEFQSKVEQEGSQSSIAENEDFEKLIEENRITNRKFDTANITINNLVKELEGYAK